jgi:GT2 family glycosyltransferase
MVKQGVSVTWSAKTNLSSCPDTTSINSCASDAKCLPSVAIVIVDYNGVAETTCCLESVNAIDYGNYDVYLVDNGGNCSAKLQAVASTYARVHYLRSNENLGFSGGNNFALKKLDADYDFVLLLNNDTVVTPDFLSKLLESADERALVGSKIYYWSDKNLIWYAGGGSSRTICRSWHNGFRKLEENYDDKGSREVGFISGCCMLIPSKALIDVGFLDESYFLYLEDTDYCFRAMDAGYRLRYNSDSVIYHCVSASTGDASALMNYYKIRNRQYFIDRYSTNKPLSKFLAYCEIAAGLLIGKYKGGSVKKALHDYRMGITGKMQEG